MEDDTRPYESSWLPACGIKRLCSGSLLVQCLTTAPEVSARMLDSRRVTSWRGVKVQARPKQISSRIRVDESK
jgi:hypothetical protein